MLEESLRQIQDTQGGNGDSDCDIAGQGLRSSLRHRLGLGLAGTKQRVQQAARAVLLQGTTSVCPWHVLGQPVQRCTTSWHRHYLRRIGSGPDQPMQAPVTKLVRQSRLAHVRNSDHFLGHASPWEWLQPHARPFQQGRPRWRRRPRCRCRCRSLRLSPYLKYP